MSTGSGRAGDRSPIDEIERYLDSLDEGLESMEPGLLDIPGPALDGLDLQVADRKSGESTLARLNSLVQKVEGLSVRIAGELADLRRRPSYDGHRRGPTVVDTSL